MPNHLTPAEQARLDEINATRAAIKARHKAELAPIEQERYLLMAKERNRKHRRKGD